MVRDFIRRIIGGVTENQFAYGGPPEGTVKNNDPVQNAPAGTFLPSQAAPKPSPAEAMSPAQAMIEEGMAKDRESGYAYGKHYEKKARKKAAKIYGGN